MAKSKMQKQFSCIHCGSHYNKWQGKCDTCGQWNCIEEEVVVGNNGKKIKDGELRAALGTGMKPKKLKEIQVEKAEIRYKTGNIEFDRVLGGGLVRGSIVLIGAKPGVGKSTLMLQTLQHLAESQGIVMNFSGEESMVQTKLRADRLNVDHENIEILTETNMDYIEAAITNASPEVIVIDSIQTIYDPSLDSIPGTVSQIKMCIQRILKWAKEDGITVLLVGQYTKEGELAGPESLMHMVDCVIEIESDETNNLRMMRASKNRFGNTFELGILEMTDKGIIPIDNPSEYFLDGRQEGVSGSVVTATLKGARPILFELQSLVIPVASGGNGMRDAEGVNKRKMNIVSAALEKHFKVPLSFSNMYTKVSGGLKVDEPAIELALAVALYSSYINKTIDANTIILGATQ